MSRVLCLLLALLFPAIAGCVVFLAAGRWDLPFAWAILLVLAVFVAIVGLFGDQGMIRERVRPGPGNQDRLTQPISIVLIVAHWIIAGLDVGRFHWSHVPLWVQVLGLCGYAACLAVLVWCMRVNRFYSSVVRVQRDRGHEPVTRGPYSVVRHPGYAASMAGAIFGGLALGSWLALLPLLVFVFLFVRRTLLEDALLIHELPGYAQYAKTVRYRIVPGVF